MLSDVWDFKGYASAAGLRLKRMRVFNLKGVLDGYGATVLLFADAFLGVRRTLLMVESCE